jgi:hypothetical protein
MILIAAESLVRWPSTSACAWRWAFERRAKVSGSAQPILEMRPN